MFIVTAKLHQSLLLSWRWKGAICNKDFARECAGLEQNSYILFKAFGRGPGEAGEGFWTVIEAP